MKLLQKLTLCAVLISLLAGCGKNSTKEEAKVVKNLGPAETVTHLSDSVANGDAEAAWESLPKTWRGEINSIAHMVGEKMPAPMWDDSFKLVDRIGKVFESKNKIFSEMMAEQLPPDMSKEDVESSIASLGQLLSLIATSDLSKVESLKNIDLGKVAGDTGSKVLKIVMNNELINKSIGDASKGKANSLKEAMANIKAELVSEEGNVAKVKVTDPDGKVEEVEMVKVEDKWVAKKMADEFNKNIAEIKAELSQTLAKIPEQQMTVSMVTGMVGGIVTTLESAKTVEDIQKAFASLPINPMALMGGALGGAQAKAQDAKEMSHLKEIGMNIAIHFTEGTNASLEGSFKQFKGLENVDFNLDNYIVLFSKGDLYTGAQNIPLACEKPDSSKDGINVVFQDGHVEKINGSFNTIDDVKKAIVAKGYKLKSE